MSLCALGLCVAMQTNTPELLVPLTPLDATSVGTKWLSNGERAHFGTPQQEPISMIVGIALTFIFYKVIRESDRQRWAASARVWVNNTFHRPVFVNPTRRGQQGGAWANVYIDVDGEDPDENGDPDFYVEWDDVDYNSDGTVDFHNPHAQYSTADQVENGIYYQLYAVDQYFRSQRR